MYYGEASQNESCYKIFLFLGCLLLVFAGYMVGTKKGKRLTSKAVAGYLHELVNYVDTSKTDRNELGNEGNEEAGLGQNGNQTLGYCRVRFIPNCNGTKYDYGRTERQRMVLSDLFERYKTVGFTKKLKIAEDVQGYIETDIDEALMEQLIYVAYEGQITKLEQRQLPAEGTFQSADIGSVTGALEVDWEKIRKSFGIYLNKRKGGSDYEQG